MVFDQLIEGSRLRILKLLKYLSDRFSIMIRKPFQEVCMKKIILICLLTLLSACGNNSSVQQTTSTTSASTFPTGLAVTSPLDVGNGTSSPKTSKLYKIGSGGTSRYNWETTIVSDILEG